MILFLPAVAVKWVTLQFDRGEGRNRWEHRSLKTWGGTLMRRWELFLGMFFRDLQCHCFAEPRNQAVAGVWRLLQWCTGSCDWDVDMVIVGWDGCDDCDGWMRWRLARCIYNMLKWQGVYALDPVIEMLAWWLLVVIVGWDEGWQGASWSDKVYIVYALDSLRCKHFRHPDSREREGERNGVQ